MKIHGNTTGSYTPRADFAETDPRSPSFIRNKPEIDITQVKSTADAAKTTADAAKTAADEAKSAAEKVQSDALPKSGGEMTGAVKMKGIYLTPGVDYGKEFPEDAEEGRLFRLEVVSGNG